MNRCLIRGLRNASHPDSGDWRTLVTMAVQGKWPTPAASPGTHKTESGLGILGEPYYFYVLRAEDSFGLVVFVLREAEDVTWPEDARGATPFDTGGWWSGRIRTEPPLDEPEKQAAFGRHDVPLRGWQDAFEQYIQTQYGTISDYLEGRAPKFDHPRSETRFTIIRGQPNTARAWTWEVHVPHDLIAGHLTLKNIYMTEVSRDEYVDWLWRSDLADSESLEIHRWISDHVKVPTQDESPVRAVRESMMLEAAHG